MINVPEQKQELLKLLQLLHNIESTEILEGSIDPEVLAQKRKDFEWSYKQEVYGLSKRLNHKENARPYQPETQN